MMCLNHIYFLPSMSYQWGKSVMSENECVAIKAFIKSTELFDRCIGMSWFHVSVCTQKNYHMLELRPEKKVGTVNQKCIE